MISNRLVRALFALLPIFVLAGCPGGDPDHADAADGHGGHGDADPVGPKNELATACASNDDCISGNCVDGVCCDSPCDQACLSCALPGAVGHCGPIASGPDPVAATPCAGDSACFLNRATSLSSCKTVDGASCSSDEACGSGHCLTYYVDVDADGYGTAESAKFCSALNAAPPAGYAAYTGDCCDIDNGANPGFSSSTYLQFPNACGAYDWDCNGVTAPQYASGCPLVANPIACGANCDVNLGIVKYTAFAQGCN